MRTLVPGQYTKVIHLSTNIIFRDQPIKVTDYSYKPWKFGPRYYSPRKQGLFSGYNFSI